MSSPLLLAALCRYGDKLTNTRRARSDLYGRLLIPCDQIVDIVKPSLFKVRPWDADRPEESFERGPVRLPAHGHAFLERLARAARQIRRALIALLTASDLVWT